MTTSSPCDHFALSLDIPREQTFARKYKRQTVWCCHLTEDDRGQYAVPRAPSTKGFLVAYHQACKINTRGNNASTTLES